MNADDPATFLAHWRVGERPSRWWQGLQNSPPGSHFQQLMAAFQKKPSATHKTKAELREMLRQAVENRQLEKKKPRARKRDSPSFSATWGRVEAHLAATS